MAVQNRTNLPIHVVLGGALLLALLALFGWVALGMGSAPATEEVTVDVSPKAAS